MSWSWAELVKIVVDGWLVGCFGLKRPFETVFQSVSGRLPETTLAKELVSGLDRKY